MQVHLIAIQAEILPDAYRTADAFRQRVLSLVELAVAGLPASADVAGDYLALAQRTTGDAIVRAEVQIDEPRSS